MTSAIAAGKYGESAFDFSRPHIDAVIIMGIIRNSFSKKIANPFDAIYYNGSITWDL
jgi:hypothetical protein